MRVESLHLLEESATLLLGARLSPLVERGDVICLSGPLGAGKTTLARGLIEALTGAPEAPSPTFGLVETYEAPAFTLWHFDLFRLANPGDVWELGLEEALAEGAAIIEWPEMIAPHIPLRALFIQLALEGGGRRALFRGDETWLRRLSEIGLFPGRESRDKDS